MAPVATPQASIADPIHSYEVGDDTVILLGATALVTSKSESGMYREVDALRGLCACPAFAGIPGKFEGRGTCRHVRAVRVAEDMDRITAKPVERELCPKCSKRPRAIIAGVMLKTCCICNGQEG